MASQWWYGRTQRELERLEEIKKSWRKMTDEEKTHLKELEDAERNVSHYKEIYMREIHNKEGSDNMKNKPQVTPERREELLRMVMEEYHFNGDVMPTARQLKKSHLFKLYELWNAFGNYDNLCKVVEKKLGVMVKTKKIAKKARDDKVKLMQSAIEQKQEKEVKDMQEKEMDKKMVEKVQELVQEVDVATEVAGDAEEKKEIIRQDEPLNKKKRNVKVYRTTKEDCIAELKRFYEETGKLPTTSILKERRDAGEDWLSYNTIIRYLGPKESWLQYLDGEKAASEENEAGAVSAEAAERGEEDMIMNKEEVVEEPLPTAEMFEAENEMRMAEVASMTNISLKISLRMPGVSEPFELEFDLFSK